MNLIGKDHRFFFCSSCIIERRACEEILSRRISLSFRALCFVDVSLSFSVFLCV